jgi:hypothetical protein
MNYEYQIYIHVEKNTCGIYLMLPLLFIVVVVDFKKTEAF